jgi:hypothetical protein
MRAEAAAPRTPPKSDGGRVGGWVSERCRRRESEKSQCDLRIATAAKEGALGALGTPPFDRSSRCQRQELAWTNGRPASAG